MLDKVDVLPPPGTARRCCSTCRGRRTRCGTRCPDPSSRRSSTAGCGCSPSTPTPSPARPGSPGAPTPSCRPLLRDLRGAAPGGGAGAGQGDHPQDLRPARRRGRTPQRGGRRQCGGGAGGDPGPGHRGHRPRPAPRRTGLRARVRPDRDRRDDGRPRRRPAGERAAGRRHLPERHHGLREAPGLRPGRRVGPRVVHPVRQLQLRVPAQRDPVQVRRRGRARRCARGLRDGAAQRGRPAAGGVPAAGLCRGLHRLRPVRGVLPGEPAR